MSSITNKELSVKIIELLGGKENIINVTNCMTRVRINVKSRGDIRIDELKSVEGVMGVVEAETIQIVVGPGKAKKVADILNEDLDLYGQPHVTEDWQKNKQDIKKGQKQSKLKSGLETIAGIFVPLIPAIIAAGIFNGFSSLIGTMQQQGGLPQDSQVWEVTRLLFSLIGTSFLGYFAIFTGVNAARRFGATEGLGGMVGAMSISAQIVSISEIFGLYDAQTPLNSILTTGKGGIVGVIIGVYLLSKIEKFVRKNVPDVLDLIVTPIVTLLVTALIFVFAIMPLSGIASDWLVSALSVIIGSDNMVISVISGYLLAALFLPMVLLGLHHGLIPIYAIQLEAFGGVSLFPVLAMAGAGQVGAAIAIYLISKKVGNDRMRQVIAGALPAGILGIGEPLIYGVTLPLGKPFITAGLGAGFGGAYVMATQVMATAWGPSGLVAVPLMQPNSMVHYVIGIFISYIAGFIITRIFIKDSDVADV